jgi:cobalt/nickel transport system ATP-binding protein
LAECNSGITVHHRIEIENAAFAYPDGQEALRGVSLKIEAGEKVALVGQNGAGKSTLILHLNGILRPRSGTIQVAGMDVNDKTLSRVRAAVGLVFQMPDDQLFSPTVFDDVAFGPIYQGLTEAEVRSRVDAALGDVGMGGFGPRVSHHLSIGQKKRVAIACVLAMQPEILVLTNQRLVRPAAARADPSAGHPAPDHAHPTHDLPMVRVVPPDRGHGQRSDCRRRPDPDILGDAALLHRYGLE